MTTVIVEDDYDKCLSRAIEAAVTIFGWLGWRGLAPLMVGLILTFGTACDSADPGVDACTRDVIYWSRDHPDVGLDYQEMGLSGDTYDALRTVRRWLDQHPDQRAQLADQARAECRRIRSTSTPSDRTGWP